MLNYSKTKRDDQVNDSFAAKGMMLVHMGFGFPYNILQYLKFFYKIKFRFFILFMRNHLHNKLTTKRRQQPHKQRKHHLLPFPQVIKPGLRRWE